MKINLPKFPIHRSSTGNSFPCFGEEIGYSTIQALENEAVVDKPIPVGRSGRIFYQGSWWPARCTRPISLHSEAVVHVVGRQGLTLFVEPIS